MTLRPVTGAVVTGAGSGLGRALVLELASRGAKVVASDISASGMEETVELARKAGGDVKPYLANVRDPAAVKALLDTSVQRLGKVDFWANNAGVAVGGAIGDVPIDDWKYVFDVNLWGVVHGCHFVAPYFKEQRGGTFLNVASAAGLVSSPGLGPYNVTKAGVVALSETLYNELRPSGVGVTVLCPTFFPTNIARDARNHDPRGMKMVQKLMDRSAWKPADVARVAVDDALSGRLYCVPMRDGQWMWRLKRLLPGQFHDLMGWSVRKVGG
jgi:NAD(P)-dependent dehydrogenase (short-subunit alcohol dehydrogenase family)